MFGKKKLSKGLLKSSVFPTMNAYVLEGLWGQPTWVQILPPNLEGSSSLGLILHLENEDKLTLTLKGGFKDSMSYSL